jgi:lauroyl/myristoyl acyltransferase
MPVNESDLLSGLFADARKTMLEASRRRFYPPRVVEESLRTMARHLQLSETETAALREPTILHQFFLPSALAAHPTLLVETSRLLPESYERFHAHVSALKDRRPLVILMFHFSGVPIVGSLLNHSWIADGQAPRHFLLAPRNAGWLTHERGRWLRESGEILIADRAGLRTLISGLRKGHISHLLLLVDGPQDPASSDAHAVTGIPTLAFRPGLLQWLLSAGVTVVPVTNYWEEEQLRFEWHDALSPQDGVETVAGLIGRRLRQHPEQWFNWAAAGLRT